MSMIRNISSLSIPGINWHPAHMRSGMKSIIGKLNTCDCVVEVHDARIPFLGRNLEFRKNLGIIKPHILVLNKSDLADLSRWETVRNKLRCQGDENVILTDLTGTEYSFRSRGYNKLLQRVVDLVNQSNRYNRQNSDRFKLMIVGIPNVGKSTLINRLRQQHLGKKGEPARTGATAGVTKHVENIIRICSRPPIYSYDTPGVLQSQVTRDPEQAYPLALCSSINDRALNPIHIMNFLIRYLNQRDLFYVEHYMLDKPATRVEDFMKSPILQDNRSLYSGHEHMDLDKVCWWIIGEFRRGRLGRTMFD